MTRESKSDGEGSKSGLSIGQMSELTGVSRRMLRHWEQEGLISPLRDQSNYRHYLQDDVAQLERIVTYREMGFNARQIKALLNCKAPLALDELQGQRSRIEEKIQLLRKAADRLDRLIALAEGSRVMIQPPRRPVRRTSTFRKHTNAGVLAGSGLSMRSERPCAPSKSRKRTRPGSKI